MNAIDIAVLLILLVSGALALMRGFVHEVLSITGWVGAGLVALHGLPFARPIAAQYIQKAILADVAAGGVLFLVALVILSLITHSISKRVRESALGPLDRSLGFVFGILRGGLLVSLAYLIAISLMQPDEPEWIAQAKTRPLMVTGAKVIQTVLPEGMGVVESTVKSATDRATAAKDTLDKARAVTDEAGAAFDLRHFQPKPKGAAAPAATDPAAAAYGEQERKQMERLIENTK